MKHFPFEKITHFGSSQLQVSFPVKALMNTIYGDVNIYKCVIIIIIYYTIGSVYTFYCNSICPKEESRVTLETSAYSIIISY